MGNFNRDNRFSRGRDSGQGRRDFGRRDFDRPEMHKAVCNKCGKDCEVPFRPTGSKPVFCRDCFKSNDNFDANRSEGRRDFGRPTQPNYKEQFEALNAKLDRILKILTPTVYEKVVEVKQPQPEKITVVENTPAAEAITPKKKVKKEKKAIPTPTEE